MKKRCAWADKSVAEKYYHDKEWGVPVFDDRLLFEFLILEGAQAGLSWSTILNKRDNYRVAFDNFDVKEIVKYDQHKIDKLLNNSGIVRNRLKRKPIHNKWINCEDIPVRTEISDQIAKILKKRGFKFFGTTICYAFMQAVGMVNDHVTYCFRFDELSGS